MISLTLTNVKKFMSQLLMTETFDRFSFIEGEIVTFNTFKLDGYLQKDFFDAPDGYESESSPAPLEEYSRWEDVREFCFSLIKGKRTPLSFRLILSLSPDNIVRLMEQTVPEMSPEDVQGLYLNLKFDGMHLTCITGTSFRTFTMDKFLEHAWDEMVKKYFLKKENNFRLTEDFLNELSPETDIVFLCSPSNPAGQAIDRGLLLKIADRCEGHGIRLVVDECFIDFLAEPEDYTMEKMTEKYSCLFVVQAFTKIHAIPGLRLGYGITSDEALLERMQQVRQPWSVSIPAQEAGIAALGDGERVYAARELTGRERVRMEKKLSRWGIDVIPSQANFILMHSPYDLFRLLKDRGILIRDCSNYSGLGRGWYRTAVRRSEENDRLLEAVRQICQMEEHRKDKARQEEYSG